MKTSERADTLPPGKYPIAVNIRAYSDTTIQSRPGITAVFSTPLAATGYPFIDMRAYVALQTNNVARVLAFDANSRVWLDSGIQVGTLAGGTSATSASMIPFRPGASPQPWMYIANGFDYQKFEAPIGGVVTSQKVGIAEPQTAPDAMPFSYYDTYIASVNPGWIAGGTAGGLGAVTNRISDVAGGVLPDPATPTTASVQVTVSGYQKLMPVEFNSNTTIVMDVFPALLSQLTIQAIYYFAGTTGHCVIVPNNLAAGPGSSEQSIWQQNILATLRRGSLITIGVELCYVWSVSEGPSGSVSIETSTTSTHAVGVMIQGVSAIQVNSGAATPGATITAASIPYAVTVGIGTQTSPTLVTNPFSDAGVSFQPDDYITLGINVDNLANLNEVKFLIDVSDGSFTLDFYYFTIRPSDIATAVANTATQLGNLQTVSQRALIDAEAGIASGNQLQTSTSAQLVAGSGEWTQIIFPLSALTRVGNDQTKSLQTFQKIQYLWNASGTINVSTCEQLIFGADQPDVGDTGAPYRYRVRPRSSLTGVVGNPSPETRYGISPRRMLVQVNLPSAAYDSQIDTWDIFRYGGTVTSWRFIGSTPSTNTTFYDNYDDAAAGAGDALDFDNFEPWPSIGGPITGTAMKVVGTIAVIFAPASTGITESFTNILPGTLVLIGGQNAYTLQTRPIHLSGVTYLLQFVENAGAGTNVEYQIQEPALANQMLPYMWGPDASGTVFACGDVYRPGNIYFAKNYTPDSAPDSYNLEITPPSEPLLGGETIDGLAFVASPERWWALYPQPQDAAQRYSIVQQPFTRGLAAPSGHCNDGKSIYWWAKDGIYSSSAGLLTGDLYKLFPHEGIAGENHTYAGVTVYAPDYTRTATFRLVYSLGYLYAIYQDTGGKYRGLTLDVRRGAWCVDEYPLTATAMYHMEQQPQSGGAVTLVAAFVGAPSVQQQAIVAQQMANTNDLTGSLTAPIVCQLAVNEFDGGDSRAPKQWGDFFVDCLPEASIGGGIAVTPLSIGAAVAPVTVIPTSTSRSRVPISVGGLVISDFLGMLAIWQDDFRTQSLPTKLYSWQPSFALQPAYAIGWTTLGTSYGIEGYMHVPQLGLAYVSTAPITLTLTGFDGQNPPPITLPSTGGVLQKTLFRLGANKGQLITFTLTSTEPFQIFSNDSDIYVGAWGRTDAYTTPDKFGGDIQESSPI